MARLDLTVDPKSEYERKLMTAEQAAGLVESGDLVWIPSTHTPPAILAALSARESELRDVTIRSVALPNNGWFRADAPRRGTSRCSTRSCPTTARRSPTA
jgi:acyl-CoA hydrolase